jgi:muramoyltetrapeptide carboxypeptidase
VDADALSSHMRFAGPDDVRLAALHRAAASGADLALICRGGYGISRVLGGIRYKAIAKSIERGTTFLGLSDFTAFQLALLQKTGSVSWSGPALCEGFGSAIEPDEIMLACFNDFMLGQGEGTGWTQDKSDNTQGTTAKSEYAVKDAVLWGGNLSMVVSLLGTPYFPDIKGGVLFLEDVAEHPYRIERLLTQLLHAGVLAQQKAVILGQFTDYQLIAHDRGFKMKSVVSWLRSQLKVPVLTNLPFGHVPTKVLLPVGAKVQLAVQARDALVFWGDEV